VRLVTNSDRNLCFRYSFALRNGPTRVFEVVLDPVSLELVSQPSPDPPPWSRLEFHQCPNCPLNPDEHPYCPLAVELGDLVLFFADFISYQEVTVRLETAARTYVSATSVQKGDSSLLGIYMVSCGCPVMRKLRPMVRFHLPFATIPETAYRVISMYLTAQYFRKRRGLEPDWDLERLSSLYDQVQTVNRSFTERLQHVERHDANANALVILDNFANYVSLALDTDMLDDMERLFQAYFDPED